jgi:hypothetical protein
MDPGEKKKVDSFNRHLLKREARRFFEKSARPPSFESPFTISRHLVRLSAIRILIANSANSSVRGLLSTTYSFWQWRYEQIWNLFSMVHENFLTGWGRVKLAENLLLSPFNK